MKRFFQIKGIGSENDNEEKLDRNNCKQRMIRGRNGKRRGKKGISNPLVARKVVNETGAI